MNRIIKKLIKGTGFLITTAMLTLPMVLCMTLWYPRIAFDFNSFSVVTITALFVILYASFASLYNGFNISTSRIGELVYSQGLSVFLTDFIICIVFLIMFKGEFYILPIIVAFAAQIIIVFLFIYSARKVYFSIEKPLKTLVIQGIRDDIKDLFEVYNLTNRFDVKGSLDIDAFNDSEDMLSDIDAVFICGVPSHERNLILKRCIELGIMVYTIPRIGDAILSGSKETHLFHIPIVLTRRFDSSLVYLFIKRSFDIILSVIGLVVLSPLMLIVSFLIKADGGPVFYKQKRLTKDGEVFNLIKFRSMRVDAEKDGLARLSTGEKDERITRIGRIIRKVRIDEIPQLINILKGEMTIVGPRPERPEIAEQYEKVLPEFKLRLQVKAGLTGYAQVYGKYSTTPYDKLVLDLQYIAKASVVEDLKVIFMTVRILFLPESTEGIAAGHTTAMDYDNTITENDEGTSCKTCQK